MHKASMMDEYSSQENSIQNGGFMHSKNIKRPKTNEIALSELERA
jgi:hypothetical protein